MTRPRTHKTYYLIAYDIPDNTRRSRVAQLLEGYGDRLQYSVFLTFLNERKLRFLINQLNQLIKPDEDKVHLYYLCQRCWGMKIWLGQAMELDLDKPVLVI